MRDLQRLVVGMGVLIVVGVAVIGVTIARRMSSAPTTTFAAVTVDQPAGTRVAGIAGAGDRLAVWLTGGGPDRVVMVDPRTGGVTGNVAFAPSLATTGKAP